MKKARLLEVTLRDGSYAVNFSFTGRDTALICKALEDVGLEYIEIGHGVGLGASGDTHGRAAARDEEYMQAAADVLTKAQWGVFCIPGIATLEDLDVAKKYGMGFVRIGTNVTEVESSEEFIKRAKKHGMFVAANYMKSYALPPAEFAQKVLLSEKYGADMVYIVDSAGSMNADDIAQYFKAIRKVSSIPVGFHGHDNLGLAIANSIAAVEMGIEFVDSSLQGLGRSAGNACTEVLVAALQKCGYDSGIDLLALFDVGQKWVQPLLPERGRAPLDIVCGLAEFHSSYMPHIQKYSAQYDVDPSRLIMEVSKIDKINVDPKTVEAIARKLPKSRDVSLGKYRFNKYVGGEQDEQKG